MKSRKYSKSYAASVRDALYYGAKYAPVAKSLYKMYSTRSVPAVVKRSYQKNRKRRPYRCYKKAAPQLRGIKKDIRNLKRQQNSNQATYIKKFRSFDAAVTANENESIMNGLSMNSVTILQGVIDSVKYFDPATPATLITVDLTSPTFQNQVRFTKSYCKILARNNYVVPARVTLYVCKIKKDSNIIPSLAISNGIADMSNAAVTSPLIYPSDSHEFRDLWSIVKSKRVVLLPGEECSISHSFPAFKYDVALSDSHGLSFQTYFHGSYLLVRVEGVPAHGSTSGVTQSKAGVDIEYQRHHTVKYPGGADIEYLEVSDNRTSITGTIQVSQLDTEQATYGL